MGGVGEWVKMGESICVNQRDPREKYKRNKTKDKRNKKERVPPSLKLRLTKQVRPDATVGISSSL
jgi:hypothetical protein